MTSAARPDGTLVSAMQTKPLPRLIIMKPMNAPLRHWRGAGRAVPRQVRNASRIVPAARLRSAESVSGAMPSMATWIAK
jgi:hypothetical protein